MLYSDPDSSFAVLASSASFAEELMKRIDFVFERFDHETRYELGMFDNLKLPVSASISGFLTFRPPFKKAVERGATHEELVKAKSTPPWVRPKG